MNKLPCSSSLPASNTLALELCRSYYSIELLVTILLYYTLLVLMNSSVVLSYGGVFYFNVDVIYFNVAHLLSTQREERAETTLFVFHLTVIFLNNIKSTTTK